MLNGGQVFEWQRLGDIELGRENLGVNMPVIVYRLMQYTIIDVLQEHYGAERAHDLLREAGQRAGAAFALNTLDISLSFDEFVAQLQTILRELKVGILRIEKSDLTNLRFVMTVEEDLDCSGLPVYGETVCYYDEGFLAGVLEVYTKQKFYVREIDCWATGGRVCRFQADKVEYG